MRILLAAALVALGACAGPATSYTPEGQTSRPHDVRPAVPAPEPLREVTRSATYEGITVEVTVTERQDGGFGVSRASYLPTQWNQWAPGHPIRIARATGSHLRSIRAAVHALGRTAGVEELR